MNSVASPVPTGYTVSYQHVCEDAAYPVWRRWALQVPAGSRLTVYAWLRKDTSMTYLPRVQIIDQYADPLVDASNAPLAEAVMSNSVDTWEYVELSWDNNGTVPRDVWIRTLAKNASGNMYAALSYEVADMSLLSDVQTLLTRLTDARAAALDNLDAAVSSRASAADTATLLARLTDARASNLDNLDAAVSSRATDADMDAALAAITNLPGEVWEHSPRTLTMTAAQVESVLQQGTTLSLRRGDTWEIALTGLGNLADRDGLWWTLKLSRSDADERSLAQIEEGGGLLYINRATAANPTHGRLAVDDEATGAITVTLEAVETAQVPPGTAYVWDVQVRRTGGQIETLTEGTANVVADVTRAT